MRVYIRIPCDAVTREGNQGYTLLWYALASDGSDVNHHVCIEAVVILGFDVTVDQFMAQVVEAQAEGWDEPLANGELDGRLDAAGQVLASDGFAGKY